MCIGDRQVGYSNSRHRDVSDANEDADLADWPHGWDLHSPSTKGMDHLLQMGYGKAPCALRASLGDALGTRLATESIPESLISAVSQKDLGDFLHMCRQAEDETADAHSLVSQGNLQMHPFLSPMTRQLYRGDTFKDSETGEFPSYHGFPPHVEVVFDTIFKDENSFPVRWDNQMHPELSTMPPVATKARPTWYLSDKPQHVSHSKLEALQPPASPPANTTAAFYSPSPSGEVQPSGRSRYYDEPWVPDKRTSGAESEHQPSTSNATEHAPQVSTEGAEQTHSITVTNKSSGQNEPPKVFAMRRLDTESFDKSRKSGGGPKEGRPGINRPRCY